MTTTPPEVATVLEVERVEFSYGTLQVLFGISFAVRRGQALALLGTNGAGKSTLLRIVAGVMAPTAGRVTLRGDDITGQPAERLAGAGLVLIPGGRAVFADMSVSENLEMQAVAARLSKPEFRNRRDRVFETFPRLGDRERQAAGTLSGGEQQQLALAKALLLEPEVLCIDELSLGLAPVVVQQLMETVRAIHASGVTVVLVEQSLNIAAQLCDEAVFMEKGAVKFAGKTRDLMDRDDIARAVFLGDRPSSNGKPARRRRSSTPVREP